MHISAHQYENYAKRSVIVLSMIVLSMIVMIVYDCGPESNVARDF